MEKQTVNHLIFHVKVYVSCPTYSLLVCKFYSIEHFGVDVEVMEHLKTYSQLYTRIYTVILFQNTYNFFILKYLFHFLKK